MQLRLMLPVAAAGPFSVAVKVDFEEEFAAAPRVTGVALRVKSSAGGGGGGTAGATVTVIEAVEGKNCASPL